MRAQHLTTPAVAYAAKTPPRSAQHGHGDAPDADLATIRRIVDAIDRTPELLARLPIPELSPRDSHELKQRATAYCEVMLEYNIKSEFLKCTNLSSHLENPENPVDSPSSPSSPSSPASRASLSALLVRQPSTQRIKEFIELLARLTSLQKTQLGIGHAIDNPNPPDSQNRPNPNSNVKSKAATAADDEEDDEADLHEYLLDDPLVDADGYEYDNSPDNPYAFRKDMARLRREEYFEIARRIDEQRLGYTPDTKSLRALALELYKRDQGLNATSGAGDSQTPSEQTNDQPNNDPNAEPNNDPNEDQPEIEDRFTPQLLNRIKAKYESSKQNDSHSLVEPNCETHDDNETCEPLAESNPPSHTCRIHSIPALHEIHATPKKNLTQSLEKALTQTHSLFAELSHPENLNDPENLVNSPPPQLSPLPPVEDSSISHPENPNDPVYPVNSPPLNSDPPTTHTPPEPHPPDPERSHPVSSSPPHPT